MVCVQAYWLIVTGLIFAFIESGFALRCWKCSSDLDATCRDYFNTTRILQNQRFLDTYNYASVQPARNEPRIADCEGMGTSTFRQYKDVCVKRVVTVPNGPDHVTRECKMVMKDLKMGACPEDAYGGNTRNLEYCGTCEYDGCNSASRNNLIFVGLVPAVIMLLRK